jgi:hypothetical protein
VGSEAVIQSDAMVAQLRISPTFHPVSRYRSDRHLVVRFPLYLGAMMSMAEGISARRTTPPLIGRIL